MSMSTIGSSRHPRPGPTGWSGAGGIAGRARACGSKLLFVDDNVFLLEMAARAFARIGVPCRTAETHDDAIEALEHDRDLRIVILDFEMPDGDVADLVRRIREVRPDVVLVGSSGGDRRREFAERGVDRYVGKPWGLEELVEVAQPGAVVGG